MHVLNVKLRKTALSILCSFLCTVAFSQTFDLSDIHTLEEYNTFKNRKDVVEALGGFYHYLEDVTWNEIALGHVILYDSKMWIKLDYSVENNTIKCIDFLKSVYKDKLKISGGWSTSYFSYEDKNCNLKLTVDSSKESIDKESRGELTISFKEQYDVPLAQISNAFDENFRSGKLYYVDINHFGTDCELLLNGVLVAQYSSRQRRIEENSILLNPFIIDGNIQNLSIKITPGEDENGEIPETIRKNSYFTAKLVEKKPFAEDESELHTLCDYFEYVTDTIVEDGSSRYYSYPGTYQYGKKMLSCNHQFTPEINYNVTGWENGVDLRENKDLKNEITALYRELANAIESNNEKKVSDLLYQVYDETVSACYNSVGDRTETRWKEWLPFFRHAYKYDIADKFDLIFSQDGKLVYANSSGQQDMLRVIGKQIATGFSFYMYKDKSTKQLKFIRE